MSRDVYSPSEDTHLLIRAIRESEGSLQGKRVLDVGTGSGAVAEALADAELTVAVDISPLAARMARERVGDVVRADLTSALRGPFDVVAFNAPYLPSSDEERVEGWLDRAFHGGEGGVEVSAAFVRDLRRVLAPGGRAYLVVSSRGDLERLANTIQVAGFRHEKVASERFFFEEIAVWRIS